MSLWLITHSWSGDQCQYKNLLSLSFLNQSHSIFFQILFIRVIIFFYFVSEEFSSKNIPKLTMNEASTEMHAVKLTTLLGKLFRPRPLIRKPNSGNKGTNQTKFIILVFYMLSLSAAGRLHTAKDHHFNLFNMLTSFELVFLNTITIIARPTATSAAASAMIKNTKT